MDHAAESVAGDAGSATAVAAQQGVDETDGDDKKLDGDEVVEDGDADDDDDSNSEDSREAASAVLELDPASTARVDRVNCAAASVAAASAAAVVVLAADGTGA